MIDVVRNAGVGWDMYAIIQRGARGVSGVVKTQTQTHTSPSGKG